MPVIIDKAEMYRITYRHIRIDHIFPWHIFPHCAYVNQGILR